MAQKFHLGGVKDALLVVEDQAKLLQALQNLLEILLMLLCCLAGHQDVVQVDEGVGNAQQHLVHEPLEGLPSIAESKRHPEKLVQPEGGDHRCLLDVLGGHWHLVVALPQVQLAEDLLA